MAVDTSSLNAKYNQLFSDTLPSYTKVSGVGKSGKRNYNAQLATNWANLYSTQMTNDYNVMLYEDQKEYNSASAQRQRLEDAGLNPYLMMNGGDAGSVSSTPSGAQTQFTAPQYDLAAASSWVNTLMSIPEQLGKAAQSLTSTAKESIDLQTYGARNIASLENMKEDTRSYRLKNEYQGIQNYIAEQTKDNQVSITQSQDKQAQLLNDYQTYTNTIQKLQAENMPAQLKIAIAKGNAEVKLTEASVAEMNERIELDKKQGKVYDQQVKTLASQASCSEAQAKAALASAACQYEQVKNLAEQRTGIKLDNKQKRSLLNITLQQQLANLAQIKNQTAASRNFGSFANDLYGLSDKSQNEFARLGFNVAGFTLDALNGLTNTLGNILGIGANLK